jgi:hypothetical protein
MSGPGAGCQTISGESTFVLLSQGPITPTIGVQRICENFLWSVPGMSLRKPPDQSNLRVYVLGDNSPDWTRYQPAHNLQLTYRYSLSVLQFNLGLRPSHYISATTKFTVIRSPLTLADGSALWDQDNTLIAFSRKYGFVPLTIASGVRKSSAVVLPVCPCLAIGVCPVLGTRGSIFLSLSDTRATVPVRIYFGTALAFYDFFSVCHCVLSSWMGCFLR